MKYKYLNIVMEMKRNGETQKDIAELMGVTDLTIRKKLTGATEWTISEIEFLCRHFDKDFYELFERDEE